MKVQLENKLNARILSEYERLSEAKFIKIEVGVEIVFEEVAVYSTTARNQHRNRAHRSRRLHVFLSAHVRGTLAWRPWPGCLVSEWTFLLEMNKNPRSGY